MAFERVSNERLAEFGLVPQDITLPTRKTKFSAGYDLHVPCKVIISPGCIAKIPTGLKCKFPENMVLKIYLRSSFGIKNNVELPNTVGIIDKDYFNNPDNEGHIFIALRNKDTEPLVIENGQAICQAILESYHTFEEVVEKERTGGWGSTDKAYGPIPYPGLNTPLKQEDLEKVLRRNDVYFGEEGKP